jgi:hypothetical protein
MAQIDTLEKVRYILTKLNDRIYENVGTNAVRTFTKFMEKGDTSGPDYRSASIVGFGQHFQKGEIGPIRYDSLLAGRERVTLWKDYALGWRASDRLMRDAAKDNRTRREKLSTLLSFTKRARTSAEWTMEYIAAYGIRNADVATGDALWPGAGSDLKALAATDHPISKTGGTASNINAAASLTSTALQDSITLLRRTPDDTGRRGGYSPTRFILVVGPVNEWKAETILNTMQVQGSANNDSDPLNKYKKRIELVIMDELNDWDGWALFDADNRPLQYFIGLEPTTTNQKDFETSAHLFKSEFEFSVDFHDWRGLVYNSGTN